MKIPKSIKVKTLGFPRYYWIAAAIALLGVAAYIRYRNLQDDNMETDPTTAEGQPEIAGDIGAGGDYLYSGADYSQTYIPDTGLTLMPSSGVVSRPVTIGADPIAPDQINIHIDTGGGRNNRPCTKPKPTKKPKTGFHWVCVNGQWTQRANVQTPNTGNSKCGKKPTKSPGKSKHWECKGKKWVAVKNNTNKSALMDDGPLMAYSQAPFRRDNHRIDKSPINRPVKGLRNG